METVNVLIKKFKFEKSDAFESALGIMDSAALKIITADTLMRAFEIGLRYKLSTLYSEDMQHGQVIEGKLTIINPFLIS